METLPSASPALVVAKEHRGRAMNTSCLAASGCSRRYLVVGDVVRVVRPLGGKRVVGVVVWRGVRLVMRVDEREVVGIVE